MSSPRDARTYPGIIALIIAASMFAVVFVLVTDTLPSEDNSIVDASPFSFSLLQFDYFVERPLDTLFVLDTNFIEVRLDSQAVFLHRRNGTVKKFLCSTGNKKIHKAIETTEGIYCVQTKSPIAISRQFDSTKMYFWVGFDGNIGFHGLDGKGYYRFLGKRPSSHGCIRMAREDAEWMFHNVPIGTPVMVNGGNAARCFAFIDSVPPNGIRIHGDAEVKHAMDHQLKMFYHGRALVEEHKVFYFSKSSVPWNGFPLGDINLMPARQRIPPFISGARTVALCDELCRASK